MDKKRIFELYPEYQRIYGPYSRKKDGRKHVIFMLYGNNETKRTVSWSKLLLEMKIGRRLKGNETCDHIDNDYTNDSLDNLQVLPRHKNSQKAIIDNGICKEMGKFICPQCNREFGKEMRVVRHNQGAYKKAGPFCGKSCAGRYGQTLQKTFRGGKKRDG